MWAKCSWCLGQGRRTRTGAGRPPGPRKREAGKPRDCPVPSHFILCCNALPSLPQRSVVTTSPMPFFLFSQGCLLPPSCPLKRLGSDHLDVWALPRGQGGTEGDRLLPAPTLSPGLLCCFCAKASQSLPVLFYVLPPLPHLPSCPCPTTFPKELKCQLRIWGQSV